MDIFYLLITVMKLTTLLFPCISCGGGKERPVNQVNHTSWVAVVTPTDRPKSVRG